MLNSMYEIGKLWIDKENIETMNILLDSNKLNRTKTVIFIDFVKDNDSLTYLKATNEDFKSDESFRLLYKKGSSRGTNLSPSTLITEPEKTFNTKFLKWFDNYKDDDKIIADINSILEDNKDVILSDITSIYESLESDNKINVLLTIRISDNNNLKYLNDFEIFKNILFNKVSEKYYKLGSKKSKGKGICYLCNDEKELYGLVPSSIGLTFSTADKPGNIPEFNLLNQWKQCGICPDCALYLEAGKKFVEKYLTFQEYGLRYYVIPKFFYNPKETFDKLYDHLIQNEDENKYEKQMLSREEFFQDIVKELNDILEFKFLYFEATNNSFNILGYVESILPSWLSTIYTAQDEIIDIDLFSEDTMQDFFGNKYEGNLIQLVSQLNKGNLNEFNWYFGLLRDYFPFRTNNKYYLDIITSILKQEKIEFGFLLSKLLDVIRRYWRNEKEYFVKINTLKALALILLFSKLGLFNGDNIMDENIKDLSDFDIMDILDSPDKKACYLLGILTKKLTAIQFNNIGSTPFTTKLWGLSLDFEKIQKLYPMVINKLREYKVAYSDLEKQISLNLIKSENNWKLNRNETSYYFVLGYTLGTLDNKKTGEKNE